MIAEIDVWRAAKLLIDRYGENAWFEAAQRADELLEAGDLDGTATWRRIVKAVETLGDTSPPDEETPVH